MYQVSVVVSRWLMVVVREQHCEGLCDVRCRRRSWGAKIAAVHGWTRNDSRGTVASTAEARRLKHRDWDLRLRPTRSSRNTGLNGVFGSMTGDCDW